MTGGGMSVERPGGGRNTLRASPRPTKCSPGREALGRGQRPGSSRDAVRGDIERACEKAADSATWAIRRRYRGIPLRDRDDVVQEARLRVLRYGTQKSKEQGVYAVVDWIRHQLGRQGQKRELVSLELDLESLSGSIEPQERDLFLYERLQSLIEELPVRLHAVLVSYYWLGLTQREIGAAQGYTESRANQLLHQAESILRRQLLADTRG